MNTTTTVVAYPTNISLNFTEAISTLSPQEHYKIGTVLAVFGNFIIAVSLNIQKFAHRKREYEVDSDSFCGPGSYLRSGTWWLGIVLMVIGEIGNFVAYGFAPASVVAPLGCIAVLANGVLAVIFNNEALRMQDIMGGTFAVVGGFLIIQFSEQSDVILNAQQIVQHLGGWQFIVYIFVEVIVYGLIIFVRSHKDRPDHGVTLHLILVAILGSFTVISAKAVSGMLALTVEGLSQITFPIFYVMLVVMIVTTILQVKYLNQAMAKFDIATVVPVNFVLFTISAILAGAIFYQEFFNRSGITIFMFFFGCILSFAGVVFITSDKSKYGYEEATLHLDVMPNFIRSLALSIRTINVQPKPNTKQVISYPEETPRSPLLQKQSSDYSITSEKKDLELASTSVKSKGLNMQMHGQYPLPSDHDDSYTDWDDNSSEFEK